MSVIGPRPLLVEYLPYYTKEEHHRHDVRPGLSGWAQINGRNAIDSWEQRFQYDLEYVKNVCLILRQNQERAILKMRMDSHGAACIMYRILCAIRWWRDRNSSISRHSALAIF